MPPYRRRNHAHANHWPPTRSRNPFPRPPPRYRRGRRRPAPCPHPILTPLARPVKPAPAGWHPGARRGAVPISLPISYWGIMTPPPVCLLPPACLQSQPAARAQPRQEMPL